MSPFKSKQGKFGVTAVAIAAAAIMVWVAILPVSSYKENQTFASNNEQSEFFVIQECSGGGRPSASIMGAEGFVMPYTQPEIKQYVLEPGSAGHITVEYDYCANTTGTLEENTSHTMHNSTELQERFDSYNSTNYGISRFNPEAAMPDPDIERYGALGGMISPPVVVPSTISIPGAEGTGVTKTAANLTKTDDHTVQVTYVIAAEPAAVRTSYVIDFYKICRGAILTVGDEPSHEPVVQKWADGVSYGGCGGQR